MSKRHRIRKTNRRAEVVAPSVAAPEPSASWGWRGGVVFDGSKYPGALRRMYPNGYELDHDTLRDRSRAAHWDSPQARGLLQRLADNVIGTGLELACTPVRELIGSMMTDEEWRTLTREIELRFYLWASSIEPDAAERRTLAELQKFVFLNEIRDGDIPIILRYSGDASRVSPLNIQILDGSQLHSVYDAPTIAAAKSRGNILRDGLEITPAGALVAIYVEDDEYKVTRIPVRGTERRFVILPAIIDMPGQVRGIGILAPILHELQKITDYKVAELQAALVNAIIAAYVTTEIGGVPKRPLSDTTVPSLRGSGSSVASVPASTPEVNFDRPGIFVQNLGVGQDLKSFDTKRPNVNFASFENAVVKSLSAALSQPVEVLDMSFRQNYSASRAALILFWQVVEGWRVHAGSQFLAPVYEAWLREEVNAGRLPQLRANGFGVDPVRTRSWLAHEWIGQSMPSIDPVKDAQADDMRLAQGATTHERVALEYNRSDFYENAARQARERELLPKAPAPQAAPDDEQDDDKTDNTKEETAS